MVKQGVIKGIATEISITEIKNNLQVHSYWNKLKVLDVRRFTKRIQNSKSGEAEEIDLPTIQFTLLGKELPATAYIYDVEEKVEKYSPQIRQSCGCLRFGHLKANCKAPNGRFMRCGELAKNTINVKMIPVFLFAFIANRIIRQSIRAVHVGCVSEK
ncbi:hypothetical protein QAD02_011167 [Eretmocerus hayati]|uniref:Uncharacterized protein n=1 Tax=Eretmocerus hayati TaxID=131215 RepID=A0ACC2NW53_9HYME|nr:hypothetical protein QAD02_011167 [Eretmocerus hayati]